MTFSTRKQLMAEFFSSVMNATGEAAMTELRQPLVDADRPDWPDGEEPNLIVSLIRECINQGGKAGEIAGRLLNRASTNYADDELVGLQLTADRPKLELVR